jgi:hypothetical protein
MTTRMASLSVIAAALALAACASTTATSPTKPTAAAVPAGCVHDTGSRLSTPSGCTAFGRSYSQEDIARTGQWTASSALELLDPTITAH